MIKDEQEEKSKELEEALVEHHIGASDFLTELAPLLKDYFICEYSATKAGIFVKFKNEQVIRISAKEVKSKLN